MNGQIIEPGESVWRRLYRLGGAAALFFFVYSIITMIAMTLLGMPPTTAEEAFSLLQDNRLVGLIRLDLLTVIAMPLYYLLYAGMSIALWRTDKTRAILAAALVFIGVTLHLATPSVASMVHLSGQYAAAATEARKALYLAAGETVIASDMWHGTGAIVGILFITSAGMLISIAMLQGKVFGKGTAYVGILANGLDLARLLIGFFTPSVEIILLTIAGSLYLVWYLLVGRRLLQLGRAAIQDKGFRIQAMS